MEGLRMGQAPDDRQSGALMEGFEWSRFNAAEGVRLVVKSDSHSKYEVVWSSPVRIETVARA